MKKRQTAATTLLSYIQTTVPSPLQVSTNTPTSGQIAFSVQSNADVLCKMITVSVPIGDNDDEVYTVTPSPSGSINTTNWALSSQIIAGKDIGLLDGVNYRVFTINNNTAGYAVSSSFTLTITGNVNKITSTTAIVQLQEYSSPIVNPNYTIKSQSFPMTKSTAPAFYVSNFISSLAGTPTIPATEFSNGASFLLSWASNGTYFQIFQKGTTTPVYQGTATTFTLSGISTDTTFVLVATLSGATLYESLTVTISNPSLSPSSVTTSGNESVGGTLTVTGATGLSTANINSAAISGTLNVGGLSTLSDVTTSGTLTANGNSNLANTNAASLNVSGGTILNGTTINGSLAASGNVNLGSTTITNSLTASSARVTMLGGGVLLSSTTSVGSTGVQVYTDGFAVAYVLSAADQGKSSFAWGGIWTAGNWFYVNGGTVGSFGSSWQDVMCGNPNTMSLPIPAGSTWYYSAQNAGGNQMDSTIQIYWFPIGNNASSEETYRILQADEAPQAQPMFNPDLNMKELRQKRHEKAHQFVSKLEKAFDRDIHHEAKEELAVLLLDV